MTATTTLHLSIVVGRVGHPQVVIDDLWKRADGAVGPLGITLTGTAVYVIGGASNVSIPDHRLRVVPLAKLGGGRLISLISVTAEQPGLMGVAGRLIRDNIESRRLARTLAGRKDLQAIFRRSDIVVAADLTADRAVWHLRNNTGASLVHGPIAMLHALRETMRK